MFRPEEIRARLRRQPFEPVRFVDTTGHGYVVRHPDMVLVGERVVIIGVPAEPDGSVFQTEVRIAIAHIVRLEDIPVPAGADGSDPEPAA